MKPRPLLAALLAALAAGLPTAARAQSGFVSENANELSATADLDGDGREDLVLLDRATGAYRIGYQLSAGAYTWVDARSSGVLNPTGLALGNLLSLARPGLAVVGPDANRLNLLDASSTSVPGTPVSVFLSSVGPAAVGAIDIGGPGNTTYDDLVAVSVLNGAGTPWRLAPVRNTNGAGFAVLAESGLPAPAARVNRVTLRTSHPRLLGFVLRTGVTNEFRLLELTNGSPVVKVSTNVPGDCDYVAARFNASALAQFLFWKPGDSNLLLRPVAESPANSANFSLGAPTTFTFGSPFSQVFVLPGTATNQLLILFAGGAAAGVYDFNGVTAPVLRTNFTAPAGRRFSGAAGPGGNACLLFTAEPGSSSSSGFQQYNYSGGVHSLVATGALASLSTVAGGANVFQFQAEPFVSDAPLLLRSLNAGDWSSRLTLTGGVAGAFAERFAGVSNGLRNATFTPLGAKHPSAAFGLVNQYSDPISLFGLSPALGDQITEVRISPDPGTYANSQIITFSATPSGDQVWYRLNPSAAWTAYSAPFTVYSNTTIAYYGKPASGDRKSRIQYATYTFSTPDGSRDTDNDGVPDFVEIARGLDPAGGADTDGDGWNDKDELIRGSDPANPASVPSAGSRRLEERAAFDLLLTPRPWNGLILASSLSTTGSHVRTYDPQGSLLGVGLLTNVFTSGVTNPSALATNISFDPTLPWLYSTPETHFDILTSAADRRIGRELLRLVPTPAITPVLVSYAYGGSNLLVEATNWVRAASNAYAVVTRPTVRGDITVQDTLTALLTERAVGRILTTRGTNWGTNLTLFPSRSADVTRSNVPRSLLLSLERATNSFPGYRLTNVFLRLQNAVRTNTDLPTASLRAVATEIYRISSASNNAAPGVYGSPVDTLRTFLATCTLDSNYLAVTTLTPANYSNACVGASNLLALAAPRPTTNLVLRIRSDSFASNSCTRLETATFAALRNLVTAEGRPFRFPDAFTIIPGTEVTVFGYTDVTNAACAGDSIEVVSVSMTGIPVASDPDTDGDLLLDTWEQLFLDGLGANAFADHDGDGYSNLQEMFEGSDPSDGFGQPGVGPAALARPTIAITRTGGNVRLQWNFSLAYAGKLVFSVRQAAAVSGPFATVLPDVAHSSGAFDVTLPAPAAGQFYYVVLALRPL